jgi:iron complex transport system ATP-binding protein
MSAHPVLLRINNATVRKGPNGGTVILDRLNLAIPLGQHTAILGPNGSGKTSLLRLITQEYHPLVQPDTTPTVEIFGRARWSVLELRTRLGIVSPDLDRSFADDRSLTDGGASRAIIGLDAVISGFFASRGVQPYQDITALMRQRASRALDLIDASHLAAKPMQEMSTGEIRRILIARALVSDPPALLLDEPTSGLDIVASQRFLDTLRRLARGGKTIIVVTHHIHEIIPDVGRVILLRAGRVFRDGPTADILTAANLSAAFAAPVNVNRSPDGYFRASIAAVECAPAVL